MSRALALPAAGQRGRRAALTGYGFLVAAVFTSLATATLPDDSSRTGSGRPDEPHGDKESDVFASAQQPGYAPTWLDGGGGIAGVPLTEEQRKALIREAERRGLSTAEAYALAYGDNAVVHLHPDGTVHVHTGEIVVPNGPVFAKVSPADAKKVGVPNLGGASEAAKAPESGPETTAAGKPKGDAKGQEKGKERSADSGGAQPKDYYPSSGEKAYQDEGSLREALPPVLEKVVDGVSEFSTWLSAASAGTPQTQSLVRDGGNHLTMTVEAPLSNDLTLRTTVTAAVGQEPGVEPVVTSVVTDTVTGEVLAEKAHTCLNAHVVEAVAIGQAVDVVLEAREEAPVAEVATAAE
ncbi:hypothetical protein AB0A60_25440 [Streptomyces sp. NPDC046275]|uniref:hypothetical protein n=1 Tax=Streptomyces sp. NPDC046275 TaxID=3157201 RepID=UPI0033F1C4E3